MKIPIFYSSIILIFFQLFFIPLTFANNNEENTSRSADLPQINKQVIVINKLFHLPESGITKEKINNTHNKEFYKYKIEIDEFHFNNLKSHIQHIYNIYSKQNANENPKTTAYFDKNDNINLNLDLNFSVGSISPEDTYITQISSVQHSGIKGFSVVFKHNAAYQDNTIIISENYISAQIHMGKYYIGVGPTDYPYNLKSYNVKVTEKTPSNQKKLTPEQKNQRHDDVINRDEIKKKLSTQKSLPLKNQKENFSEINVAFIAERYLINLKGGGDYSVAYSNIAKAISNTIIKTNEALRDSGLSSARIISEHNGSVNLEFASTSLSCIGNSNVACNEIYSTTLLNAQISRFIKDTRKYTSADLVVKTLEDSLFNKN